MPFEILHRFLVFLGRSFCLECTEVPSLPRLGIFLPGIQAVAAGFQFSDHDFYVVQGTPTQILPSRVSTLNVFKSTLAGPLVTFPVRTSKRDLCHGHCTLNPWKVPSESGPKRCVQNS